MYAPFCDVCHLLLLFPSGTGEKLIHTKTLSLRVSAAAFFESEVIMSLKRVGYRSYSRTKRVSEVPEPTGIPGSKRAGSALFYQLGKTLPIAERAEGIYIYDTTGKRYLDGCSGAFAANIGHGNERVIEEAKAQVDKICFAYRTQFENGPANELADLLARLAPPELNRVFFVNSGSEAVETAIKLARQYWWSRDEKGKNFIVARRPSYHGATLGALSCTDYAPLNIPFQLTQIYVPKVSAPFCYHCPLEKEYPSCGIACAHELSHIIRIHGADNVAAFIAEPIGGASTGAAVPPDEYFPIVEQICHENEVLLIIDDVLAGCGRTGTFFGFDHWDITPDIVAISKGLSGGYTPIGACISCNHIVQSVLDNGGFLHGHTYAGNPLSAAIAKEVLRVIVDEKLVENSREMGTYLHERLWDLKGKYKIIGDVRGRGLLAGIEFVKNRQTRAPFPFHWYVSMEATEIAREHGLLIYPRRSRFGLAGDHVLIAPPLIIDQDGIDECIDLFEKTLVELTELTEKHLVSVVPEPSDGTMPRYEQAKDVPDYAVGHIDHLAAQPDANVTYTMEDVPGDDLDETAAETGYAISNSNNDDTEES